MTLRNLQMMKSPVPLAIFISLIVLPGAQGASNEGNATARSVWEKQQNEGLILIDIRRPEEWRGTGVPRCAVMLSLERHPSGFEGFLRDLKALLHQDLSRPFALICRTGRRTSLILPHLRNLGFKNVSHVSGGIFGNRTGTGWLAEKLPMSPKGLTLSEFTDGKAAVIHRETARSGEKEHESLNGSH